MTECLPSIREVMDSIPTTENKQTTKKKMKISGLDSILGWMEFRT